MIRYIRDALTDTSFQFSGVHLYKPSVKSVKDVYLLVVGERIDPSMHCDSLSNDPGSILSFVFNQMCDDAELFRNTRILLASNSSHTYTNLK